jgi:hypothetical protein
MAKGIKSKEFGCIWKTMFIIAMCFPDKYIPKNKNHSQKLKHFKCFYNSLQFVIPCVFCRNFIKDLLAKRLPLDFSGRVNLMYSIYLWRDTVNRKLKLQGNMCNSSPPFEEVLAYYESLSATCDKKKGLCV